MTTTRVGAMMDEQMEPEEIPRFEQQPQAFEPDAPRHDVAAAREPKPEEDATQEEDEYDSTKMDPDQEVWPGGPNFAQINAWKDEYGEIYVTEVSPGNYVIWRTLTRFEYRRLVRSVEQAVSTGQVTQGQANLDNEEAIAELVIVWPGYNRQESVKTLAGIASTIAQQAMEASGFVSLDVRQL